MKPAEEDMNRQLVRSFLEEPIELEVENEVLEATTFGISTDGLYVRTMHLLLGSKFTARFSLPNGHPIACEMQVMWINDYHSTPVIPNRPPGFGAVFIGIREEDQKAINEAIQLKLV